MSEEESLNAGPATDGERADCAKVFEEAKANLPKMRGVIVFALIEDGAVAIGGTDNLKGIATGLRDLILAGVEGAAVRPDSTAVVAPPTELDPPTER